MTASIKSPKEGLLERIRSRLHPFGNIRRAKCFQFLQRRFDHMVYARLNDASYRMLDPGGDRLLSLTKILTPWRPR